MDAKEYREETKATWNTTVDLQGQLSNAALGLVGEATEFFKDPTDPSELGDILYYLSTLRRLMDIPVATYNPKPLMKEEKGMRSILIHAGHTAEAVKKYVYHGSDKEPRIQSQTNSASIVIADQAKKRGWNLDEIRQNNIEKLRERHPDGFDPEEDDL